MPSLATWQNNDVYADETSSQRSHFEDIALNGVLFSKYALSNFGMIFVFQRLWRGIVSIFFNEVLHAKLVLTMTDAIVCFDPRLRAMLKVRFSKILPASVNLCASYVGLAVALAQSMGFVVSSCII